MGVWIENNVCGIRQSFAESLPVWECGLKIYIHAAGEFLMCHSLYGSVD